MPFRKIALFILVAALAVAIATIALGQNKFTRENWAKSAGFPVDLSKAPAAGLTIDAGNMDQYKDMIPAGVQGLVKKYGLKITTKSYEPIVPGDSYIEATNKYAGSAKTTENADPRKLGIQGYQAGLPFPQPKSGLEVAWNYTYNYMGDDGDNYFDVRWISAKGGVERTEDWRWMYITRAQHRTDIDPRPDIPEAKSKNIQYYSVTTALSPLDKKGFSAMYTRETDPKDMQGFIYVPAQRKSTRFAFGTRGDAWNNTDLLYEDVRGYMGYPEWMNWKILEKKTMLLPMNAGIPNGKDKVAQVYDFENAPHWNFKAKWEPRPTYVVEAVAKFRDYPYSKMVFYIDAESYYIAAKDNYDKKGQLWKVLINAWNAPKNPNAEPLGIGTCLVVDLQAEHATAFGWHSAKFDVGLKPDQFSLATLSKLGK